MTVSNRLGASQMAVIGLMFAFSVMSYFDRTIMTIAGPKIMEEFNISATSMGSVYSAFILSYAILMTPAGWVADRLGPRLTLFLMGMTSAGFSALTGAGGGGGISRWVGGVAALFAVRFVLGAGNAPPFPAFARMCGDRL